MKNIDDILKRRPLIQPPKTENEEPEKEPFIPFPRYLTEDLRNHLMTYRELELYIWMRLDANMYGIARVNIHAILDDLPHLRSIDRITKILRSLRRKRYIYYEERKGRRGSFNVRFDYWLLKGGEVQNLDRFFESKEVRSQDRAEVLGAEDVRMPLVPPSPRLDGQKYRINTGVRLLDNNPFVRSDKNDIEKEKKKYDISSSNKKEKPLKKVVTRDFVPNTTAEQRCKEIALEIEDPYINFAMSVLQNTEWGGLDVLEEGLSEYRKAKRDYETKGKRVSNTAAFFNFFVKKAIENKKTIRKSNKYDGI